VYKNFLNYLLPTIIGGLLPFITLPIFTRLLSLADYGVFAMAQICGSFIFSIMTLGLFSGYERDFFEAKKNGKSSELLYSVLIFVFISFILGAILTWIFKTQLSKLFIINLQYSDLLFWAYISIGISGIKSFFLLYFRNYQDSKSHMRYSIDENLLTVFFSLFFVAGLKIGISGLVFGQLISSSLVLILLVAKISKTLPFRFDLQILKSTLYVGIPLTPRIFTGFMNKSLDKYLAGILISTSSAGILSIAYKVANILFSIMTAVENIFIPKVYEIMFNEDEQKAGLLIGKYLMPFIYLTFGICIITVSIIHEFFYIFTAPDFQGGANISIILVMLYGTYIFGKIPQLVYKKKTYIITLISYLSVLILFLSSIVLIKYFGIYGSVIATTMSGLITGAITFYISNKHYKIIWQKKKIVMIMSTFFLSSICIIVFDILSFNYYFIIFFKFLTLIIYLFIGLNSKILHKQLYLNLIKQLKTNKL
jgi:O-antigen/teichoic acid export membrane protein